MLLLKPFNSSGFNAFSTTEEPLLSEKKGRYDLTAIGYTLL
jgi:hypothetical protein